MSTSNISPVMTCNAIPVPDAVCVTGRYYHWQSFEGVPVKRKKDESWLLPQYKCFDSNGNALSQNNAWVKIDMQNLYIIRRISFINGYRYGNVRKFTFQGSHDNSAWVDLLMRGSIPQDADFSNPAKHEYELSSNANYRYYRFVINEVHTAGGSSNLYAALGNVVFYTFAVPVNDVVIENAPSSMYEGSTLALKAAFSPPDATGSIIWRSSDTSVAKVSDTGMVTAVSTGSAVITAMAVNNVNITASCTIVVIEAQPIVTGIKIIIKEN